MGLDIYVGTFTRYYQRDWLTIVQQRFPDQVNIVRPPGQVQLDPETVRQAIADWIQDLAQGLNCPSTWSEDSSKPYFTDKPAWDGYGGLLLWAACEDQGEAPSERHGAVTTQSWCEDPLLTRYQNLGVETRYPQLMLGEELWLPIQTPSVFKSVDAAGTNRVFGNCRQLLTELDMLNDRTWKADEEMRLKWLREGCDHGSPLEGAARFGWAVMRTLTEEAVRHNLPVIMDY